MMAAPPRPQNNIAYTCKRCGGPYYRDDDGAWVCMHCARPYAPIVPLPYVERDDERGRGPKHAGERL